MNAHSTHKVFEKPDYSVLEAAAKELGVQLSADSDIKLAEDLFQKGVKTPGSEHGWSPLEQTYIAQLLPEISRQWMIPTDLRVYLVDRGILPSDTEETVGSLLERKVHASRSDLMEAVEQATLALKGKEK